MISEIPHIVFFLWIHSTFILCSEKVKKAVHQIFEKYVAYTQCFYICHTEHILLRKIKYKSLRTENGFLVLPNVKDLGHFVF